MNNISKNGVTVVFFFQYKTLKQKKNVAMYIIKRNNLLIKYEKNI